MQTQSININRSEINFQARLSAKALTKKSKKEIFLYSLDKTDKPFAEKMVKKLNLEDLYPDEKDHKSFIAWKNLIKSAVSHIGSNDVILAVHNKRPCGIIDFRNDAAQKIILSRFATWPIKPETKVEHAGKSLMRSLFQRVLDKNNDAITLRPSSYSPCNKSCKTFYSHLGFVPDKEKSSSQWQLDGKEVPKRCAQLENVIDFTVINSEQNVNLNKKLSLRFKDTILEVLTGKISALIKQNSGNCC